MNEFRMKGLETEAFGRAFVHLDTVESTFLTMKEIEKHVGKTDAYLRVEEHYNSAMQMAEQVAKEAADTLVPTGEET